MKVLFVCTGNSCRSVMAEFLFNHMAQQLNLEGWQARSCGTAAQTRFPIPAYVKKALAKRGVEEVRHTPELINRSLMDWADVVYAMAQSHLEALSEIYPEHRDKTVLFSEKAGMGKRDVNDPIGQAPEVYDACCNIIEQGIRKLIQNHAKPASNPRS